MGFNNNRFSSGVRTCRDRERARIQKVLLHVSSSVRCPSDDKLLRSNTWLQNVKGRFSCQRYRAHPHKYIESVDIDLCIRWCVRYLAGTFLILAPKKTAPARKRKREIIDSFNTLTRDLRKIFQYWRQKLIFLLPSDFLSSLLLLRVI